MEIFIRDLQAYTATEAMDGEWFDLNDYVDSEEFKEAVEAWLKDKGIEEYAVHDYNDCPAHDEFGEDPDLEELYMYHELYTGYGDSFAAWFEIFHYSACDCESWADNYEEAYMGEWESWEDFARYLIDDCEALGEIPDTVKPYIDYSTFARDLNFNGEYTEHDGFFFQNY